MGREDLDVPPGKTDQVRIELTELRQKSHATVSRRDQRQVENLLTDIRVFLMDRVGQIGHAERVDRPAGEKDIKDGTNIRHGGFTITQADGLCNRLQNDTRLDWTLPAILFWHFVRRLNIL